MTTASVPSLPCKVHVQYTHVLIPQVSSYKQTGKLIYQLYMQLPKRRSIWQRHFIRAE